MTLNESQKSRNSRLKDLEDKASTNIYCTNLPIDWTEAVNIPLTGTGENH